MRLSLLVAAAVASLVAETIEADTRNHKYKKDERVELMVNKVGPYANPQEAYEYYKLPYCAPDTIHHPESTSGASRWNEMTFLTMDEYLGGQGHALRNSGYDILFMSNSRKPEKCTTKALTLQQVDHFAKAIQNRWFYRMYLDDLPVWGMVGEMLPDREGLYHMAELSDNEVGDLHPYVYTTRNLIISYNNDQIVRVDLSSDTKSLIQFKEGTELEFALHVQFEQTTDEFHSRFDRYVDYEFFHPIQWFSMVLFLMGLVALIFLRTLKKDKVRYGLIRDLEDGDADEDEDEFEKEAMMRDKGDIVGWKEVHGDAFRAPAILPLFSALIGTGWQLAVLTFGVIIFAVFGPEYSEVYKERGERMQSIFICCAFSTIVSGYMSGRYFKEYYPTTVVRSGKNSGQNDLWQATIGFTVLLLPVATSLVIVGLNMVLLLHGTINSIPDMVILERFFLYVIVSIPFCVAGTLLGRHSSRGTATSFPCQVNATPRPIPEDVPWYRKPSRLIPLAGILSFGSIFMELYYMMACLWHYKIYPVYIIIFCVHTILTIAVGLTSIIVVYFCLNAENYLWQWIAFGSGASTSVYVFLYGVYYYIFETEMHGMFQFCFYFGYMALISIHLGLVGGTLGHAAASRFVRAIFQNVKKVG